MSENPRRGRQARHFTRNVPKILDLKSSFEQIFFRKLSLGAPVSLPTSSSLLKLPINRSTLPVQICSFPLEADLTNPLSLAILTLTLSQSQSRASRCLYALAPFPWVWVSPCGDWAADSFLDLPCWPQRMTQSSWRRYNLLEKNKTNNKLTHT